MKDTNLRTHIPILLLLFQPTSSLLTPHVLVPRISHVPINRDRRAKDSSLIPSQLIGTANLPRHDATNYPTSPSALFVAYPGRRKVGVERWRKTLLSSIDSFLRATSLVLASLRNSITQFIRKYWWSHPMLLALIPPYSLLFKGSWASMPDWWGVVDMGHIAASDKAHWIIAPFLGSNAAYALSGIYLMKKFGLIEISEKEGLKLKPTKLSMLGVWVTVAGLMSTVYHSVQALGSYALAESLCYVDHAIAGSATFYFLHTCGNPSKRTWVLGALSAVALVGATPNYALIHSFWHYLSALTSTGWALDGYQRISSEAAESARTGTEELERT